VAEARDLLLVRGSRDQGRANQATNALITRGFGRSKVWHGFRDQDELGLLVRRLTLFNVRYLRPTKGKRERVCV